MNNVSSLKKYKKALSKEKEFVDSQVKRFSILHNVYMHEINYLKYMSNLKVTGLKEDKEKHKKNMQEFKKRLVLIDKNLEEYTQKQKILKLQLEELKKQRQR